jgi:hypothetical protein
MMFDTILRGGRVVDPAGGLDAMLEVAIAGGKIAAVGPDLGDAKVVIDVTGKIVLPGMIDTHAHIYEHVTGKFGLNPDMVGVYSGGLRRLLPSLPRPGFCVSFRLIWWGGWRGIITRNYTGLIR